MEVSFLCECSEALCTNEWLALGGVNQSMGSEIGFIGKRFVTTRVVALVGAFARVCTHMSLQQPTPGRTAWRTASTCSSDGSGPWRERGRPTSRWTPCSRSHIGGSYSHCRPARSCELHSGTAPGHYRTRNQCLSGAPGHDAPRRCCQSPRVPCQRMT